MKILSILILFLTLTFNITAQSELIDGHIFVNKVTDGLKYSTFLVDKNVFVTNSLEKFKTYKNEVNTFEVTTSTNESITLFFSNDTIIKVEPSSEFRIDGYSVTLKDIHTYPSKISVDSYNGGLSLTSGEAYFSIERKSTNDQLLLQTSVSNIGLEGGKYYVQSSKQSVMIYVLDGSAEIYDNLTNKKESIKSGNAVLIHPAVTLSPKQKELFADKMTTTVKKATISQFKPHLDIINELETIKSEVIFINIDSKIVGVKVK